LTVGLSPLLRWYFQQIEIVAKDEIESVQHIAAREPTQHRSQSPLKRGIHCRLQKLLLFSANSHAGRIGTKAAGGRQTPNLSMADTRGVQALTWHIHLCNPNEEHKNK
jgi:hypothetical protein